MDDPSKVTKVLIDKIHGGRKQDSKFWQSEFSDPLKNPIEPKSKNRSNYIESTTFFILSFIAIGIASYGGYFMYKKYHTEFSNSKPTTNNTTKIVPPPQQITKKQTQYNNKVKQKTDRYRAEDRPITKKELDRAIQKALTEKRSNESRIKRSYTKNKNNNTQPISNFYYRVELVNGALIKAKSATKDGDLFTIKDRQGMKFSLNRSEIKSVKKVPM